MCCVHRNSVRRKREEKATKRGQADKQDSFGIQAFQTSPSSNQKAETVEIKERRDSKDNRNSQGSGIPAWRRDPEPLPDWTLEQQRVFMNQLDENPLARRNDEHLKRAMEKTHRLIPEKTIEDIELCYRHLQLKRIAYFGTEDNRRTSPAGKIYKSYP